MEVNGVGCVGVTKCFNILILLNKIFYFKDAIDTIKFNS
jgi:hypothetical protein